MRLPSLPALSLSTLAMSIALPAQAQSATEAATLPAVTVHARGADENAKDLPYTVEAVSYTHLLFDVVLAASSQDYCDEITGMLASHGLVISELTTHIFEMCIRDRCSMVSLLRGRPRHVLN